MVDNDGYPYTQEEYENMVVSWNTPTLSDFIPKCDKIIDILKRRYKHSIPGKMHKKWKCRSKHALLKQMVLFSFKYIIDRIINNGDIFQLAPDCRIQPYVYSYTNENGIHREVVTPIIIYKRRASLIILSKKHTAILTDNYRSGKIFVQKYNDTVKYGGIYI